MAEFVTVMNEKERLCNYNRREFSCKNCELWSTNTGSTLPCYVYMARFPEEAEKIVMDWAERHPVETMKDRFFNMFPNAPKDENGYPECCPHQLGWAKCGRCKDFETCLQYWNRPYEENK